MFKFIASAVNAVASVCTKVVSMVTGGSKKVAVSSAKKPFVAGLVSLLGLVAGTAQAALPAAADTALDAVLADGQLLIDAAWPIVGGITVGFIIIKLFKRAANKV